MEINGKPFVELVTRQNFDVLHSKMHEFLTAFSPFALTEGVRGDVLVSPDLSSTLPPTKQYFTMHR